jgi:hypothetical protein
LQKILLTTLALLASTSTGHAAAPTKLQLNCKGPSVGYVEITLANPKEEGDIYYTLSTKRYDSRTGQLIGERSYPIDEHAETLARIFPNDGPAPLKPEPILSVTIPAFGVDWARNSNSCYVKAPTGGLQLQIGVKTKQIVTSQYEEPLVNPYETNPEVESVLEPGVGFGSIHEVLHGEECPDLDQWRDVNGLSCSLDVTN